MKIKVLGTGAAEGIPAVFCTCPICQNAMQKKGKEIRTRSQILVDDTLLIDWNADTYYHKIQYEVALEKIQHLLITHSHTDHFLPFDLTYRGMYYANNIQEKLHLYGNEHVLRAFEMADATEKFSEAIMGKIIFHPLSPFSSFPVSSYQVHTLLAKHMKEEDALLYTISKEGKTIMIGYDTARFLPINYDYLIREKIHPDCIFIDGTSGKYTISENGVHMGLPDVVDTIEKLKEKNIIQKNCRIIITHISHNGGYTHDDYVKKAAEVGFEVAYDGMELEI